MKSSFIPNRKADMRYRRKSFLRSKERMDDPLRQEQAEYKKLRKEKNKLEEQLGGKV